MVFSNFSYYIPYTLSLITIMNLLSVSFSSLSFLPAYTVGVRALPLTKAGIYPVNHLCPANIELDLSHTRLGLCCCIPIVFHAIKNQTMAFTSSLLFFVRGHLHQPAMLL